MTSRGVQTQLAHTNTDLDLHQCSAASMPKTLCGLKVADRPQVSTRKLCKVCWS